LLHPLEWTGFVSGFLLSLECLTYYLSFVLTVIFTCKTTDKLLQYTKVCQKMFIFNVLKCPEKACYFHKQKLTISPDFFDPNLPIFGFSRLAALPFLPFPNTISFLPFPLCCNAAPSNPAWGFGERWAPAEPVRLELSHQTILAYLSQNNYIMQTTLL